MAQKVQVTDGGVTREIDAEDVEWVDATTLRIGEVLYKDVIIVDASPGFADTSANPVVVFTLGRILNGQFVPEV